MATSRTSTFISHVNGDPDAEPVLHALATGLKQELAPSHDAYEIVYDREIIAGREWRREIYGWLYDCPAAIVLISEQALKDDGVWVAFEANYLSVDQVRRPEQCIIPVWLRGVDDQRIRNARNFKTGRFPDIQALRFPNPPGLTTFDELACAIAERIKQELPARGVKRLVGLVAELCDKLSEFPKPAQNATALVLDPASTDTDAAHLAEQFLAADEIKTKLSCSGPSTLSATRPGTDIFST